VDVFHVASHVTDAAEHPVADGARGLAQMGANVQRARLFGGKVTATHVAHEAAAVVIIVAYVHQVLMNAAPLSCAFNHLH